MPLFVGMVFTVSVAGFVARPLVVFTEISLPITEISLQHSAWRMFTGSTLSAAAVAALLGDLAASAGQGYTRLAIARRAAAALVRQLPLVSFELGWCEDSEQAEAYVADLQSAAAEVRTLTRTLGGTRTAAVLHSGVAGELPLLGARSAEERHAAAAGAVRLVVLPLRDEEGGAGYAALGFSAGAPDLDAAVLAALVQVLTMAQHNERRVGRVAALSRRAHKENQELRRQLLSSEGEDFVARSEASRQVLAQAELVAPHETTVLLRGESGTGKELLARRIHQRSGRAAGPLVAVNCGALPESLVESELFGHEAGAFTGAARQHSGRFERANGGTLLLDEIAELPLGAQVKLLRVLQEGTFERVGGQKVLRADVRVIVATHRPLEDMVQKGTFRADLFYRLSVFPIMIPPLRERPADIAPLVAELLPRIAARLGRRAPRVTAAALERLTTYSWPGNVRELENVLERALILRPGDTLELPPLVPLPAAPTPALPPIATGPGGTLQDAVRRNIEDALSRSAGRIYGVQGAAVLLGLKPSTLQSKLKALGIDPMRWRRKLD